MRRFFLSVVASLLLASPVSASLRTEYIYENNGGLLMEFIAQKERWIANKTEVQIHGRCESACTVYLSMPKELVCVGKNARIGVHRPWFDRPPGPGLQREADRILLNNYPKWMRQWIKKTGGLKKAIVYVPNSLLNKHVRTCA
jgi:hypothetical protein